MPKRYLGNIITDTPTPPADNLGDTPANGVWALADVRTYEAAGLWPNLKNGTSQYVYNIGDEKTARGRVNLNTLGDETSFGTMSDTSGRFEGVSSNNIRGLVAGNGNTILYWTLASDGTTTDFGDRTVSNQCKSGANNTRSIMASLGTGSDVIDYVTIASTGNATDFGDLTVARGNFGSATANTRTVFFGGWPSGSIFDTIDYITTATTGNATDFGDLIGNRAFVAGLADGTRAVCSAGLSNASPTTYVNTIDYITVASTGNATDFGDNVVQQRTTAGAAGSTRGLFVAGDAGGSGFNPKAMYYITIQSTGNSALFGEMTRQSGYTRFGSCSNATVAVQP